MLPKDVKRSLFSLGVDKENRIDHKNYLDTLRVIYLLGLAEGYQCNFIMKYPCVSKITQEIFHVGGANKTWKLNNAWNVRGTYLWRRALEKCTNEELQSYYFSIYGDMKSTEIFSKVPDLCEEIGEEFFKFIDEIVSK